MTETVTLLPCPFCGAPGRVEYIRHRHWQAQCSKWCDVHAHNSTRANAIAAWNTRAQAQIGAIERYDNGSYVELDSYAGGAAPEGSWGSLTLAFYDPSGKRTVRGYVAADMPLMPTPSAPAPSEPTEAMVELGVRTLAESVEVWKSNKGMRETVRAIYAAMTRDG